MCYINCCCPLPFLCNRILMFCTTVFNAHPIWLKWDRYSHFVPNNTQMYALKPLFMHAEVALMSICLLCLGADKMSTDIHVVWNNYYGRCWLASPSVSSVPICPNANLLPNKQCSMIKQVGANDEGFADVVISPKSWVWFTLITSANHRSAMFIKPKQLSSVPFSFSALSEISILLPYGTAA